MANFEEAYSISYAHEVGPFESTGGLIRDQGGLTKYGISEKAFPNENIAMLTKSRAKQLYKGIWDKIQGDAIGNQSLANFYFDYALNSGPGQATKDIQRALNYQGFNLSLDSAIGPKTLSALKNSDQNKVLKDLFERRKILFYLLSKRDEHKASLKGWLKRLNSYKPTIKSSGTALGLILIFPAVYLLKKGLNNGKR